MEGHKGIEDFHTILVHHYVVDHCYSAINSFNIRLTDDEFIIDFFFVLYLERCTLYSREKINSLFNYAMDNEWKDWWMKERKRFMKRRVLWKFSMKRTRILETVEINIQHIIFWTQQKQITYFVDDLPPHSAFVHHTWNVKI